MFGVTHLIVQTAFQDCFHSVFFKCIRCFGGEKPFSFPPLPGVGLLEEQPPITLPWLAGGRHTSECQAHGVPSDERDGFHVGDSSVSFNRMCCHGYNSLIWEAFSALKPPFHLPISSPRFPSNSLRFCFLAGGLSCCWQSFAVFLCAMGFLNGRQSPTGTVLNKESLKWLGVCEMKINV